jgi:phage host-nuclease inhibitor protein Gam
MKRIKLKIHLLLSADDAEFCLNELAGAICAQRALQAERDSRKLDIEAEYAAQLLECDLAIKEKTESLKAWAQVNPQLFGKRKSLEFPSGKLGFRTGMPKLSLLNRKWTWAKVLDAVRTTLPAFIREKPEVDKEAIIAQSQELAEFLPLVGVKVEQGETFFVEPAITETKNRVAA